MGDHLSQGRGGCAAVTVSSPLRACLLLLTLHVKVNSDDFESRWRTLNRSPEEIALQI